METSAINIILICSDKIKVYILNSKQRIKYLNEIQKHNA